MVFNRDLGELLKCGAIVPGVFHTCFGEDRRHGARAEQSSFAMPVLAPAPNKPFPICSTPTANTTS